MVFIINSIAIGIWLLIIHRLDVHTADKKSMPFLFLFFASGMLSVVPTLILYTMTPIDYLDGSNDPFAMLAMHVFIVGPVEETAKFFMFFAIATMFGTIKEPVDGMLQGISVALGFAAVENLMYGYDYGVGVLLIRSIISTVGHIAYASVWGFYLAIVMYDNVQKNGKPDYRVAFLALIPAAFLHGMGNFLLSINWIWHALLFDLVTVVMAVMLLKYQARRSPFTRFKLDDHLHAIPVLEKGVANHPENPVLLRRLARFHLYTGNYRKASKSLSLARKSDKKSNYLKTQHAMAHWLATGEEKSKGVMLNAYGTLSSEKQRMFRLMVSETLDDEKQARVLNEV
jgi:RsiW-degrading membrane proteinase PrsW (M82 family)